MPTLRSRTIKPTGGNYADLSSWQTGEAANIVAADEIREWELFIFSGGLDDASAFAGAWTTSATQFVRGFVPLAERHTGTVETGAFFKPTGGAAVIRPVGNGAGTGCDFMELVGVGFSGADGRISAANGGSVALVNKCFSYQASTSRFAVGTGAGGLVAKIMNSMVVAPAGDGLVGIADTLATWVDSAGDRGIVFTGGTGTRCQNNVATRSAGVADISDQSAGVGTFTNNITEDGTGQLNNRTLADASELPLGAGNYVICQVKTAGSQNLTIVNDAENDAINAGANLISVGVTDDYRDVPRATSPEIGPSEIPAAALDFISPLWNDLTPAQRPVGRIGY